MDSSERKAIEKALAWRAIIEDPDASELDRRRFREWLASDERNQARYDQACRFWLALQSLPEEAPRAYGRVRSIVGLDKGPRLSWLFERPLLPALGVAAVVLAVLIVAQIDLYPASKIDNANAVVSSTILSTDFGEVRDFTLSDGSVVTLGAKSNVRVDMMTASREVTLERGDAYFAVQSNPSRPFRVRAGIVELLVTGTRFDVQKNETSTQVSVEEGSVQLTHPLADAMRGTDPQHHHDLRAGQAVIERDGIVHALSTAASGAFASWRENRLTYYDAPLSEVVADLRRYSSVAIEIDGSDIASVEVSGTFDVSDAPRMLMTLAELLQLQMTTNDEGTILLWEKDR